MQSWKRKVTCKKNPVLWRCNYWGISYTPNALRLTVQFFPQQWQKLNKLHSIKCIIFWNPFPREQKRNRGRARSRCSAQGVWVTRLGHRPWPANRKSGQGGQNSVNISQADCGGLGLGCKCMGLSLDLQPTHWVTWSKCRSLSEPHFPYCHPAVSLSLAELCPPRFEVQTCSTSECDCLWRQGLWRTH